MPYVECYILPVIAARMAEYEDIARKSAALWLEHGALTVVEAVADHAPVGELTSFPRSVILAEGEVVVLSYLTFRDRAHRDAVINRATEDQRMTDMMQAAPVDGKRMIWGGFSTFVNE